MITNSADLLRAIGELNKPSGDWDHGLIDGLGEQQSDCFIRLSRVVPHAIFSFFAETITSLLQDRLDLGQHPSTDQLRMFNIKKSKLRRSMVDNVEFNARNSGDTSAQAMLACNYVEQLAELTVSK
ncbi:MAG: hypothetical protein WAV40_01725 [Microgenomates group bacterium]